MKINATYNFIEGKAANYLKEKFNMKFEAFNNPNLKKVENVKENQIRFENGFAIYDDGNDEYLMFYYLPRYRVKLWKTLPKYHVCNCETRETYRGYRFANKMPVNIYSTDESIVYENMNLKLCKNCSREVFKSWWGKNEPYYEAVLAFIANQENPMFHITGELKGYHKMWRQISEAYREKMNWACENRDCQIDLSQKTNRKFLHTHHINGDTKLNTKENFEALCLLHHSLKHKNKLKEGTGFLEVDYFIEQFKNKLPQEDIEEYKHIKNG